MPILTKELIELSKSECAVLIFQNDGTLALGYEWLWEAICDAALREIERKP